jgi:peptidylprolyl isomerase
MTKIFIIALFLFAAFFFFQRFSSNKNASQNIAIGETFLLENGKKEGMSTTDSGLQYEVLVKGDGIEHPTAKSKVEVHYHGTLIDGTVFDSSVDRGQTITFGLNQVIKGWTEGVQLMVEGDKFRFYIPSTLAYGNNSAGSIPAGATLIFEVELIDIK